MDFTRKVTYKGIDYSVKLIDQSRMIIKAIEFPIVIHGYYSDRLSMIEQVYMIIEEANIEKTIERIDEFLN